MTVDNEFNNKLDKISLSHTNSNDIKIVLWQGRSKT